MVFFIELFHRPHTYFLEARSIELIFTSLAWVPTLKLSVRGSETSVCLQPGRLNDTMEPSKVREWEPEKKKQVPAEGLGTMVI